MALQIPRFSMEAPAGGPSPEASGVLGLAENIGRIVQAKRAAEDRKRQRQMQEAGLERQSRMDALDTEYKQAQINKLNSEAAFLGGQGGGYTLGGLLGLDPSDPRSKIPVNPKQAPGIVAQGITAVKPSQEEAASVTEAKQLGQLGTKLAQQWQSSGFQSATAGQAAKGLAAGILPGAVSQRMVGPEYKQFEDTKSLLSEIALRQATGAAAPDNEKRQYMGYLPSPGDSPEVAANKIDNFFGRVGLRAEQTAARLEAQGLGQQAQYYRTNVLQQLEQQRQQMALLFGAQAAPAARPQPTLGRVPAPGASAQPGAAPKRYKILSVE